VDFRLRNERQINNRFITYPLHLLDPEKDIRTEEGVMLSLSVLVLLFLSVFVTLF
jgi:hypothetical protein